MPGALSRLETSLPVVRVWVGILLWGIGGRDGTEIESDCD